MTTRSATAESDRLRTTHLSERANLIGMSVREADQSLRLDGSGHELLDTTHFDVVRFPPPDWAVETFAAAASDGQHAYTAYRGSTTARTAAARGISGLLGITVDPDSNIALSAGTQGGLFTSLGAVVDEGDVVGLTDPEYLFVERMLRFFGADIVRIGLVDGPTDPQLDLGAVERAARGGMKLMVTSNPNNPTGSVYSPATLHGLAQLAVAHDFMVVIDELYCRLVYDETPYAHLTALPGMTERTITLLGGSKTESLSGYRIGTVVGPKDVIDAVEQMMAICCLRAPAYSQQLLTHWLLDDDEFVSRRVRELKSIRDMTVERLRGVHGLELKPGHGTAYLWPDVSALGRNDVEIARLLQQHAGVIVSPGYQFGPSGVGHFRVCFAREERQWSDALDRMVTALNTASVGGT